jgi:hypothetical protein
MKAQTSRRKSMMGSGAGGGGGGAMDKGYVALTANTRLMRSLQQQIEKGKGVTLKVDQVALSPQTRREVITAIPEAMMRAVIAEQQRPIRRANAVIFGLMLLVICLLSMMAHQQTSRLTEKTVHWAANDVSANANKEFEHLLADRNLNPHVSIIPRDVALTGAKLMTDLDSWKRGLARKWLRMPQYLSRRSSFSQWSCAVRSIAWKIESNYEPSRRPTSFR